MRIAHTLSAFCLTTLLTQGGFAQSGIIAYDGFSAASIVDIEGYNGGFGWTSPWTGIGNLMLTGIVQPGLSAPGLATQPGGALSDPWNATDATWYTRTFGLVPGNTLYVSFLYRPDAATYGSYGGIQFGNYPAQMFIGSPGGYYTYGFHYGRYGFALSNVPETPDVTAFVVVQIEAIPATSQTVYRLWIDPTAGMPPPAHPDLELTLGGVAALPTALTLTNDGGVTTDEIRIGVTWSSVTPTPCAGDVNGDRVVNESDLGIVLSHWQGNVTPGTSGDLTGDGLVNESDLGVVLARWAVACT
ncbi:MAG: dockerin type I domain-containing protein [Phycisphaerae bacterium]